jgi:hypothetical protein
MPSPLGLVKALKVVDKKEMTTLHIISGVLVFHAKERIVYVKVGMFQMASIHKINKCRINKRYIK